MQMSFDEDFSPKLLETRLYIRLSDGELQLVRVTPMANKLGLFISDKVAVYVDEGEVNVVPRSALEDMLSAAGCIPLEDATHWKHKKVH